VEQRITVNTGILANNPKETNQKPAHGFLIAHFKRYVTAGDEQLKKLY